MVVITEARSYVDGHGWGMVYYRGTNKEHTGRKANAGLTNHLCAAKENK